MLLFLRLALVLLLILLPSRQQLQMSRLLCKILLRPSRQSRREFLQPTPISIESHPSPKETLQEIDKYLSQLLLLNQRRLLRSNLSRSALGTQGRGTAQHAKD